MWAAPSPPPPLYPTLHTHLQALRPQHMDTHKVARDAAKANRTHLLRQSSASHGVHKRPLLSAWCHNCQHTVHSRSTLCLLEPGEGHEGSCFTHTGVLHPH